MGISSQSGPLARNGIWRRPTTQFCVDSKEMLEILIRYTSTNTLKCFFKVCHCYYSPTW